MQNNQHKLSLLYTVARLADALETLDIVHSAASDNTLETLNARGKAELVARLQEIAYVANETIAELEQDSEQMPFRVIKGGRCEGGNDPRSDRPYAEREPHLFEVLVQPAASPSYPIQKAGS